MKKVLLLNNVPSPYLTPFFNKLMHESGWDLLVCYVSRWSNSVGWSEEQAHEYLFNGEIILDEGWPRLRRLSLQCAAGLTLLAVLWRQAPNCLVIYGYTRIPQLTALFWCLVTGKPFVIAGDATYYADNATGLRKWLKTLWLGWVERQASAILVVGKASRMFWEAYGAHPEQIVDAPFAVDNDWFTAESDRQQNQATSFREQQGWQNKTIFLFAGRLIERKQVDLLIKALQQVPGLPAVLLVVGDGEERVRLKALAESDSRIQFFGNASQHELAFYYALADVLVLPARAEPWGLVINEAMACGLAVIAHWQCGAAVDLVAEDNGVVLRSFAVDEIAAAIEELTSEPQKLAAMQERSREKIADWSFEQAAAAIRSAVESADQSARWHVTASRELEKLP